MVSCNVDLFSLFVGQIKRSMYAFSPVECLDCTSNLTAAGLGWLVKVLWFACDTTVCVRVDLLNFVPLGFVVNYRSRFSSQLTRALLRSITLCNILTLLLLSGFY